MVLMENYKNMGEKTWYIPNTPSMSIKAYGTNSEANMSFCVIFVWHWII